MYAAQRDEPHRVTGAVRVANRSMVPALHFRMIPRDLRAAVSFLTGKNCYPLGTFHSHVAARPVASIPDLNMMRRFGGIHLIIGEQGQHALYRRGAFRWEWFR